MNTYPPFSVRTEVLPNLRSLFEAETQKQKPSPKRFLNNLLKTGYTPDEFIWLVCFIILNQEEQKKHYQFVLGSKGLIETFFHEVHASTEGDGVIILLAATETWPEIILPAIPFWLAILIAPISSGEADRESETLVALTKLARSQIEEKSKRILLKCALYGFCITEQENFARLQEEARSKKKKDKTKK